MLHINLAKPLVSRNPPDCFEPKVLSRDEVMYPRSFGEDCLSEYEDLMRTVSMEYNVPPGFWQSVPEGMSQVRRALYHRNRDNKPNVSLSPDVID